MLSPSLFFLIACFLRSVTSVPVEPAKNEVEVNNNNDPYDLSQFDAVYDQRQNGSENLRINIHKVVLVWTPPGSLMLASLLVDPELLEQGTSDLDEFFKPDTSEKPQGSSTVKPETTKAPDVSTEAGSSEAPVAAGAKRRLRLPGFIRPFVRRHHTKP
ncbi:uncharacterized protein [Tenebrio molitor]|uniref:uncharacterized protein n=1 Tax=Tenebrio molitor TaxID=7067 RepID=UPI003624AAF6